MTKSDVHSESCVFKGIRTSPPGERNEAAEAGPRFPDLSARLYDIAGDGEGDMELQLQLLSALCDAPWSSGTRCEAALVPLAQAIAEAMESTEGDDNRWAQVFVLGLVTEVMPVALIGAGFPGEAQHCTEAEGLAAAEAAVSGGRKAAEPAERLAANMVEVAEVADQTAAHVLQMEKQAGDYALGIVDHALAGQYPGLLFLRFARADDWAARVRGLAVTLIRAAQDLKGLARGVDCAPEVAVYATVHHAARCIQAVRCMAVHPYARDEHAAVLVQEARSLLQAALKVFPAEGDFAERDRLLAAVAGAALRACRDDWNDRSGASVSDATSEEATHVS